MRIYLGVSDAGLEPTTLASQTKALTPAVNLTGIPQRGRFINIGFSVTTNKTRATKTMVVKMKNMAIQTGIEPAISCVTGRHVNRYTTGPL